MDIPILTKTNQSLYPTTWQQQILTRLQISQMISPSIHVAVP